MKDSGDFPLGEQKPVVTVYAIMNHLSEYSEVGVGQLEITTDDDLRQKYYVEVTKPEQGQIILCSRLDIVNNFQKQKGTIICWTDSEQSEYEDLALSFTKEETCDFYWRIICERIGKDYLNIGGKETIPLPSQDTLPAILEATEQHLDALKYTIINSQAYLEKLFGLFKQMRKAKHKEALQCVSIVKKIVSSLDLKVLHVFLNQANFESFLKIYEYEDNSTFSSYKPCKAQNLIPLEKELDTKIHIHYNANYFREHVLLGNSFDSSLQSALLMLCRDIDFDLVSYFSRQGVIQSLIERTFPMEDQTVDINELKISLMLELFSIERKVHADKLKVKFLDRIYASDALTFISAQIQSNHPRAVELLENISAANQERFLEYLRKDFRNNSQKTLNRILSQKYCQNNPLFRVAIINLILSFSQELIEKKEYSDFFNGTFFCYVIQCCQSMTGLLDFVLTILKISPNVWNIFSLLSKARTLQKVVSRMQATPKNRCKECQLMIIKILGIALVEKKYTQNLKSYISMQQENKVINYIIESGLFKLCLSILQNNLSKNNILSSAMLVNLDLLDKMEYSQLVECIKEEYNDHTKPIWGFVKAIVTKEKPEDITEPNDFNDSARRHHEKMIENQEQENYLLNDDNQDLDNVASSKNSNYRFHNDVEKIREEIMHQEGDLNEPRKMRKLLQSNGGLQINIDLDFDDDMEEN